MQQIHALSPSQQTLTLSFKRPKTPYISNSGSSYSPLPRRVLKKTDNSTPPLSLKRLTSRIVQLTRRRQLRQIFEEIEVAKREYGKLNRIVMNAVMDACVHCGDVDLAIRIFQEMLKPESCGVDTISFGILLKGLGESRRIDEAFQLLESVEKGTAVGSPKLSPTLIYGLLNSLIEAGFTVFSAGDLRRAHGLLARYRSILHEDGPSILMYNLLIKGYIKDGSPQDAFAVRDEILRQGLKPDRLTYNTLVFACVKSRQMDAAMQLFAEMKVSRKSERPGFSDANDFISVQKLVIEMKSSENLIIDRIAYTAIVDALLICGSTKGALCIFGEILKLTGVHPYLRPKPHLYLSMMRTFALKGDYHMVKCFHARMWPDTSGTISPALQVEADELLMEAAINDGQVDVAREVLSNVNTKWEEISWTSRGSMAAVRVEALSGFSTMFSPYLLPQVILDGPIKNIMMPFDEAQPLHANMYLEKVVMRFFRDAVVPVIDDWGSCVGLVHREDCKQVLPFVFDSYFLYKCVRCLAWAS
ncbi:hypothetical protein IFM89_018686 [Coptis chinensis]|uniref:Pentatricopeptide repeat-containing protein n=1 Tax=Coptis chinensis TaxID=261450 RepID=A0A835I8N9_9MAGN|nr:hypothetical protein IFM89_018686 [Coptis chinensis]